MIDMKLMGSPLGRTSAARWAGASRTRGVRLRDSHAESAGGAPDPASPIMLPPFGWRYSVSNEPRLPGGVSFVKGADDRFHAHWAQPSQRPKRVRQSDVPCATLAVLPRIGADLKVLGAGPKQSNVDL